MAILFFPSNDPAMPKNVHCAQCLQICQLRTKSDCCPSLEAHAHAGLYLLTQEGCCLLGCMREHQRKVVLYR